MALWVLTAAAAETA